LQVYDFIFKKDNLEKWVFRLSWTGLLFHTLTFIGRWVVTGHIPVIGNYENTLTGTWIIVLAFRFLQIKFSEIERLNILVLIITLLTLGYGIMSAPEISKMTPAYQSPWLVVHIVFAWLAYMSFTISAVLGIAYLLKDSNFQYDYIDRLPDLDIIDELGYRFIAFGLVMDTVMLVSGSIWANRLWGSYWSWDPVETWSLLSWLIYALYLHLRLTFNWEARKSAWLAVGALIGVLVSFWGVNVFNVGRHIFNKI
jgi:cytochrome c-type biogenesis protein CcsB